MKNPFRFFCFLLCVILPIGEAWSLGSRDMPRGEITVTGRVRLVGTVRFNSIVVTDSNGNDWYVEEKDREKLASLEQRQVTVKGVTEYEDIILADGRKAGIRRFLRNITLVE
jgi:hypothetical protein